MGTNELKCKRSFEMEPSEERKNIKLSIEASPTQGLGSTKSETEENPHVKKWELVLKYKPNQKDVEKSTEPKSNGSPKRKPRPADKTYDKTPLKQYTGISSNEMKLEDQESSLDPISTLKQPAGFEVGVGATPAFGSKEELLSVKMSQDKPWVAQKRAKITSHEVDEEDYYFNKAKVDQLRKETSLLSRELKKHADMCMQLTDANRLLMDELKKMCEPHVIAILEAKNPDNNLQTDRGDCSCHSMSDAS